MPTRLTSKLLLVFVLFIASTQVFADIPPKPTPPRLVNDLADVLTTQQENSLERKLVNFNDTTSNQITIVTVKSLDGYDPNMFAYEIGEKWQVGQKKFDNGIVVLIKPKYGNERGRVAIQAGYGLEAVITDAISKRIIENEMIPEFRNNNYYQGIDNAANILMGLAAGEISADGYGRSDAKGSPLATLLPFLIFIIIFILIRVSSARSRSVGKNIPFWTALWMSSSMGSSSGSWNSFSGGSSGFGGGGFGGFGGGSFGGGGASGSW